MPSTNFRGRRAVSIESDSLRVTVLREGGHIAEICDKQSGVSPLWIPAWPSVEPSGYDPGNHPQFGAGSDAKLLAGIMGHNLCVDIFGGPSPEEAAAGVTAHGEASVFAYEIAERDGRLLVSAEFPLAQLGFERSIELRGRWLNIRESVRNLAAFDRPIGWTQHVSIGPPFLERGRTQVRASVTRSKVYEGEFGPDMHLEKGREFAWPLAPLATGGQIDLREFRDAAAFSEYTAHLIDPLRDDAFFTVYSPAHRLALTYLWRREDFPWLGIWQENCSRRHSPWDRKAVTLGMEFGVSPMPESRREMVDRGRLFGMPTYRWLPAHGLLEAEYWVSLLPVDKVPEEMVRPDGAEFGQDRVTRP